MKSTDVWATRIRFMLGASSFAWEVAIDHHDRWWVIILSFWLLGGPLEDLIRFLTAGRLHIQVVKDEETKVVQVPVSELKEPSDTKTEEVLFDTESENE